MVISTIVPTLVGTRRCHDGVGIPREIRHQALIRTTRHLRVMMHDVIANDEHKVAEIVWVQCLAPGGCLLGTFQKRRDEFHAEIIHEVSLFHLELRLI